MGEECGAFVGGCRCLREGVYRPSGDSESVDKVGRIPAIKVLYFFPYLLKRNLET